MTQPTADELLPCDVKLSPATTIAAGCKLSTLIEAFRARGMTAPSTADEPTDAMIEQLVRNAYEEGVEDGVGWRAYPESGPRPQWIDSVARIETLKAMHAARPK